METNGQTDYTRVNLLDVEDAAAKHGFGETGAARFPAGDLHAERTGLSLHSLLPGRRQSFGHRHRDAEEVYVVLAGSGRAKLDEQVVELKRLDAIRVAPPVARCFEADDDGLELLALGARHQGDGEILPGWWS
ncbi:cupin domain-containing protein [Conexibacter sp. CPCC 206217]|uniref:cupin domain-containing protein n=1 Tax=Conexibacter sp. CPCC 206217 TaxID=3064574 RepID=UPI002722A6E8|nr:cupin domain-containing protein [Conexibacter sp. CPCC 206217]MDO8209982.1 cupin domain-containing protein [Conexibacter sp. CPCC 206217]